MKKHKKPEIETRWKMSELKLVKDHIIDDKDGGQLCIKQKSVLSPMLAYLIKTSRLMYNMRFCSPGIKNNKPVQENTPFYMSLDSFYHGKDAPDFLTNQDSKFLYIKEYHTVLLQLFPSLDGHLSIFTHKEDSFYMLISSKLTSEQRYKLFASLLLLSEGIEVPLIFEYVKDQVNLILKRLDTGGEHFRINMSILEDSSGKRPGNKENCKKATKYEEAMNVINFFIKNKNNTILQFKGLIRPRMGAIIPEFNFDTGDFLSSPKFLIHTYIYEYITTAQDAICFCHATFALLCEYIENIEYTYDNHAKNVFCEYFILARLRNNERNYFGYLCQINKVIRKNKTLPFSESLHPQAIKSPKCHIRSLKSLRRIVLDSLDINVKESMPFNLNSAVYRLPEFINSTETIILSLFCCFAYDQNRQIYTTKHMKHASSDLKSFFDKYKYMFERTSYAVHSDWNKVVADLNNKDIFYIRPNRNQIEPGLLNILRVITEIAGIYKQEKKKIDALQKWAESRGKDYSQKLCERVLGYIQNLFKALSVNKNITLPSACITYCSVKENRCDMFGFIRIGYKYNEIYKTLRIIVQMPYIQCIGTVTSVLYHTQASFEASEDTSLSSNDKRILNSIILFSSYNVMFDCLLGHYSCFVMNQCTHTTETLLERIKELPAMNFYTYKEITPNTFLLDPQLYDPIYSLNLARQLLIHAVILRLNSGHSLIIFLSNLLENILFGNEHLELRVFTLLKLFEEYKSYLPDIHTSYQTLNKKIFSEFEVIEVFTYITNIDLPFLLQKIINAYIVMCEDCTLGGLSIVLWYIPSKTQFRLLNCLTKRGLSIEYILSIINSVKNSKMCYLKKAETVCFINTFLLEVIGIACQNKDWFNFIIKDCYNLINFNQNIILHCTLPASLESILNIVNALKSMKDDLCRYDNKEDNQNFYHILNMYETSLIQITANLR
ncbi:hypothetical protein NEPAR06_0197 [Nematocida parisii]|uniref:Uncharacterized protein n=1 Tax=Nematocida parisii (strain ERTm3) TaxID=935791 RepID=I3EDD6_NEMP3|nr:uncharacterized protein NEPG_00593 [Nematocida parisii ERTm1]EIJ87233.1 hypothetical protein NEQG_02568 [Nematocida parisii ERTm3]KAI5126616.1 hypothetical protein NEPAR08_0535 [Nematocida parisii]EIJ95068.1 hypothetical protein NEPG_00593 [Nematocida parisii ERTm1]KAI5127899.1 hypothetical protein NEPAR03_1179 [Nematocida parisii]KAI5143162.1 hypothetical protein NEPAR07_0524 [Nematocida parisii]|eukprot:XP_013058424.1 hypothetical protein NEPG_00593 [Nematocida parisii ERTm1]